PLAPRPAPSPWRASPPVPPAESSPPWPISRLAGPTRTPARGQALPNRPPRPQRARRRARRERRTAMDEQRLAALEARLRLLEDEREIQRLVAAYGPLVDGGRAEGVAALWTEDGVYDVDGLFMSGRAEIAAMVRSAPHQNLI